MASKQSGKSPRTASKETSVRWDAPDQLKTKAQIAAYLNACMEEAWDDPALLAAALGGVARARGMAHLAKATGLSREGLYKSLAADGNPSFGTILKVMKAFDLKLTPKEA
jgi:probable addiction module antidote protein